MDKINNNQYHYNRLKSNALNILKIYSILFIYQNIWQMSKAERDEVADYVNKTLENYGPATTLLPISSDNLTQALHDGVIISYIVNCLSKKGPVINENELRKTKATVFHKLDQVNKALDSFKSVGLNIINIRAQYIVQKKENAILGLFNQIAKQKPAPPSKKKSLQQPKKVEEQPTKQNNEQQQSKSSFIPKQQHAEEKHESEQNFVLEQKKQVQEEQFFQPQEIQQAPVSKPVQPVQEDPREKIYHLQINRNQYINPTAYNGYQFETVLGPQIVVLSGSLRKGSVNHGLVHCLEQIKSKKFFENIYFHTPDLSILPLMNSDLVREGKIPKAVIDLRQIVRKSSGILISTPEYNGTFSGIIKNAFDWLSFPFDPTPLTEKKIGVISASYLTQNQIKDTIQLGEYPKCNYFRQTFYVSLRSGAFNMEQGILTDAHQKDRLALWYQDFIHFLNSVHANPDPVPRFLMNP